MNRMRVFLAHPKSLADVDGLSWRTCDAIQKKLNQIGAETVAEVITGRDDFFARAADAGGMEEWTKSVGMGRTYREGGVLGPMFDAIVVAPSLQFGAATARIVHYSLEMQKPVYFFDVDRGLLVVRELIERNGNDWQTGWTVRTAPQDG